MKKIKYLLVGGLALGILLLSQKKALSNILTDTIGIKETGTNQGFDNIQFERIMKELGWQSGWEWCVGYVKYVWYNWLKGTKRDRAMSLISFNSQQTYNNFSADKSGYFEISDTPKIGSIAIFQKTATSGHAGIVEKIYSDSFDSIEGNYSDKVSRVKRKLSKTYIYSNGLKLRGFINIK